jgi:hypothetical protein
LVDSTRDEDGLRDPDTRRVDVVVVGRGVRWGVVMGVTVRIGVFVRVDVPSEVPTRVVAVVHVVVVPD